MTTSSVSVLGLVSEQHDGVTTAHVGSLVTGASRRVVFRLDLPAMTSPGLLPLIGGANAGELAEGDHAFAVSAPEGRVGPEGG